MIAGLRSFLFVPANNPARLGGAAGRGADAIIIDLEDAVAPHDKAAARNAMVEYLRSHSGHGPIVVRVNSPSSEWFASDWEALRSVDLDAVMVPKATDAAVRGLTDGPPVIALVETAEGVEDARQIAMSDRVARLMLGSADLAADVGSVLRADETDLLYARSRVAYASAAAAIEGPIDVVHLTIQDVDGLRDSAVRGRELGFTGKACIHPSQVAVVNAVFTPTPEELDAASNIVAALESSSEGSLAVYEGKLIDPPVAARARRTLAARREVSIP